MRARAALALLLALGLMVSSLPGGAPRTQAVGAGDTTPPSIIFAAQWTSPNTPLDRILVFWDDLLDTEVTPDAAEFTVDIDGFPATVSGVTYDHAGFFDPTIALHITTVHLDDPVVSPGSVTVSYAPGTDPIQDEAGNDAVEGSGLAVDLLNATGFEPVFLLVDGSYAVDHIGLLVADPIDDTVLPPASAFTGTRNGVPFTATSVAVFPGFQGRILDIAIPVSARTEDTILLSYTAPGSGGLESTFGEALATFSDAQVFLALVAADSTSGSTPPEGGSVSTDVGDPGPTSQDPTATSVSVPGSASVVIDEGLTDLPAPSSDYTFIGETIEIEVDPPSTAEDPLVIDFSIDDTVLAAAGVDEETVAIFRNGVVVGPCTGPAGDASPDPCIQSRTRVPAVPAALDYAVIRVLTSHASTWTFAAPSWSGFFSPVDNAPVVNQVKAGGAVPVKFSLGTDRGLAIFAPGSPSSQAVGCSSGAPIDIVEQTVSSGSTTLTYDPATGRYTYVWKTSKAWTGCRELTLTFNDGTTRSAIFQFK